MKKTQLLALLLVALLALTGCGKDPKVEATAAPTQAPTEAPTAEPTEAPTAEPTEAPTAAPTEAPTAEPTEAPTAAPTEAPTAEPTEAPTAEPTEAPTTEPTEAPTAEPTEAPTAEPTEAPTAEPTEAPQADAQARSADGAAEGTEEDPVLATAYNGEVSVKRSEIQEYYDQLLQTYVGYYAQYGYQMDEYDVEFQKSVAQEAVQMQLSQRVAKYHAEKTGYALTPEREEELKAEAETAIESMREYYEGYLGYYGYEGEELQKIVDEEMAASGYTAEKLYETVMFNDILEHLFTLGTEGVTVTDEEIRAYFDGKVAQQKETYADADAFIQDYMGGTEVLYTPENVRVMQCIFIGMPEAEATPGEATAAEATAAEAAAPEATATEADPAQLTGLDKANAVLAKLRAGEDFAAMMEAYSEDNATPEQMAAGYPITAESELYGDEYKAAAMALAQVGDISDVVVTDYGYFILRYAQDLTPGEVDFDSRKDIEAKEALENKQNEAYSAYVDKMMDEAAIQVNDLTPLYHIFVSETVEATVAYMRTTAETQLTDMPAGDAVATLAAGASLDVLGRIGMDGEQYAFVAVPGTAFKGYVNVKTTENMEPDEALAVDNTALAAAAAIEAKLPTFTIAMNDGSLIYGELYPDVTPESVGNFISLANAGFYDGLVFHRVIPGFMIQGGDPNGDGTGGPGYAIRGEFKNNGVENDLSHTRGVLSMARSSAMDSAGSQFFIMHADNDYLDGDYAGFGMVLGGIETVDLIASTPTNNNDKPMTDQVMRTVFVETYGKEYTFTKLED